MPVGMTSSHTDGKLRVTGTVTSLDGTEHVECTEEADVATVADAEGLGSRLAHALVSNGARAILDNITKQKETRMDQDRAAAEAASAKLDTVTGVNTVSI